MTIKMHVDDCPPGPRLDLAAAQAAGYVRVPFETAKATPPELADVPPEEARYVFTFVDDWKQYSMQEGVWRRRHGSGDFFLWRPSIWIADAWSLAVEENMTIIPKYDGENWVAIPQGGYTKASFWERNDGSTEYGLYEHHLGCDDIAVAPLAPLAIVRAYLKAKGVEYVEVSE